MTMNDQFMHPNGVLPEGNLFLTNAENSNDPISRSYTIRSQSLGRFSLFPDSLIADILSFFDGIGLVKGSRLSKIFYVFTQLDFLWRDLVLLKTKGRSIDFRNTWRETFARLSSSWFKNTEGRGSKHHIQLHGFYSQYLFHSWLCAHYDLESIAPGFYRHEDIPRVNAEDLPIEKFIQDYEIPNRPVIITGALNHQWNAITAWNEEYLLQQSGENLYRATSASAVMPAQFTMKEYLSYASQVKEESPLYLFERKFYTFGKLGEDYQIPDYFNPKVYEREGLTLRKGYDTDLFRLLGDSQRPDHRWLVVGPAKSGSIFHIDPNQTNAWNVCVQGRKKWIFYPPDMHPPGVQSSPDGADVVVPISIAEWLINFWSFHLEARCHKDYSKRPMEAIVQPGDIVFVPHNYWHMVINLDFSVALTQNYVSTSNLFDCLKFLKFKQDQISGIRDRKEEGAISADSLYSTFKERLQSHFSNHPNYLQCIERVDNISVSKGTIGKNSL